MAECLIDVLLHRSVDAAHSIQIPLFISSASSRCSLKDDPVNRNVYEGGGEGCQGESDEHVQRAQGDPSTCQYCNCGSHRTTNCNSGGPFASENPVPLFLRSLTHFHVSAMEKNLAARMDKLESSPAGHGDEGGGKRHDSEVNEECRGSVLKKLRALPLRTQPPTCQAEKCNADLTNAKDYHRRHKVCEMHSKAPSVLVCGLEQRFCQQCSRFHLLAEFDEAKRSCRRRLAGHNERRRKISSDLSADRLDANRRLNESWCRHMEEAGRMAMGLDRNPTVNVCKEIKNNGIPQLMFAKR